MKEDIVIPAWEVASQSSGIKIFNFIPSLLATIYLSLILLYQVAWTYINIFNLKDEFFSVIINFVHTSYFGEVVVGFIVFFLLYIVVSPIAEGGVVSLIDAECRGADDREKSLNYGLGRGFKYFLPVFEANNITSLFKLLSIITFTIFLIRLLGVQYLGFIFTAMGFYFLLAVLINIFLAYTKFFIVLEQKKAFDAIVASSTMALDNLGITFKLYLTLILVYVRTLLTVLFFILLPFLISAIFTFITISSIKFIFLGLLGVIILVFLIFVSHLNSVLEIFVETLWYRAYMDNKSKAKPHATSDHDHHHETEGHGGHDDHGHGHGDHH
ncbi:MAG: hypothetical protein PHU93_00855 [Candidatus Gracilibacteria bacterium]|nr:hypothetical protein [Candidatus Gracilibacteria bacterium]